MISNTSGKMDRIEGKIDKVLETSIKNEQHLRMLNGSILELKNTESINNKKFENINEFKNKLLGGLMIISFIVSIIGIKIFLI